MAGPLNRVGNRPMCFHQLLCMGQILRLPVAFFQNPPPEVTFGLIPAPERQHHGKRNLSLAEIITDGFAKQRLLARIIQRVIHKLEGDAQIAPEAFQCRLFNFGPRGNHRTHFGSCRKQGGSLSDDDLQIGILGRGRVVRDGKLQHFALGNHASRIGKNAQTFQ